MQEFLQNHVVIVYLLRFLLCFACGICMGLERKLRQHAVGIRTLVLICVSSCLLSIMSFVMADFGYITGDPTRIATGVITGIGFIGAGGILRQGFNIRGITTAAIIFTAAAIGLACGAGLYIPALITLALELITLFIFEKIENKMFPASNTKVIRLTFKNSNINQNLIKEILKNFKMILLDTDIEYCPENKTVLMTLMVKVPDATDYLEVASKFSQMPELINFSMLKK